MYIYSREIQLVAKKCNMLVFVFSLRTANIAAEILHVHGIILILTYITPAAPPSAQNPKSVKLVFVLCLGTWRILQSWNHQMEGAMFASNSTENSWSMLPIWLLAAMMIMMWYWRFWEPWANAMSAILLPKLWIENHDWHNCFWMSCWGSPLLDQKKLQNQQFYKIDWIRKNSWSMLPIWLLAAMMIMMYYWRFWEPWANAMLVVLLPKLWKLWLAQLFLDVFLGLTLTGPKKASKPTILHNGLNKEKTPGRCCQSGYMLPWWLWCTIGGFGNPEQMLC